MAPLMPAPAQQQMGRRAVPLNMQQSGAPQMPAPAATPFMSQRQTAQPYQTGMTPQQQYQPGAGGDPYSGTTAVDPTGGRGVVGTDGIVVGTANGQHQQRH